jgi:hypothetical protein
MLHFGAPKSGAIERAQWSQYWQFTVLLLLELCLLNKAGIDAKNARTAERSRCGGEAVLRMLHCILRSFNFLSVLHMCNA